MKRHKLIIRIIYSGVLLLAFFVTLGIGVLLESKTFFFEQSEPIEVEVTTPFPVGVDVDEKIIVENPLVDTYFSQTLVLTPNEKSNWRTLITKIFSNKAWYQNLASPVSRMLVIWPGERHEEITKHFGDILRWDDTERELFTNLIQARIPVLSEGKFIPGHYTAHRDATPEEIADLINVKFDTEILQRYTSQVNASVPLDDALTIASLLEREASDFENMREISGVIWNRLFIDMPLQLDATLQYARGSRTYEPKWWPVPVPRDKYIDSPFNTYQNDGLPPAPIANPSPEAILAALNPRSTDCLFYFHDSNQNYYCSKDYKNHVAKLKELYGRGR